jgi:hypothetical protein
MQRANLKLNNTLKIPSNLFVIKHNLKNLKKDVRHIGILIKTWVIQKWGVWAKTAGMKKPECHSVNAHH